jgi:hypothetical protein
VLWLGLLSTFLGFMLFLPTCFASDVNVTMFGPKQYLRTADKINIYTDSFRGVPGRGGVIIQNGDGAGNNLASGALVLVNGMPIFDSSRMKQPDYTLKVPIRMSKNNRVLVILIGKPGSYLTVQAAAEITPEAATTQVIGIDGGTISAQNRLGDALTLEIPPLALDKDTSISISVLPNALPGPIANNIYPGAVFEPEGQQFSLPVTVTLVPHNFTPGSASTDLLYWWISPDYVLPLANQSTTESGLSAQTYHFSPVGAADPSVDELTTLADWTAYIVPGSPGDLLDDLDALFTDARKLEAADDDADAERFTEAAKQMLLERSVSIAGMPDPDDPCGIFSRDLQRLSTLLKTLLGDNDLATQISNKSCTFNVTPDSMHLHVGDTGPHRLTATLLGPAGDQRSCSSLNWYSANLNVVTATPLDGVSADLTAMGLETANVSANCDHQLGYSTVTVGAKFTFAGSDTLSGVESMKGFPYCVWGHTITDTVTGNVEDESGTAVFSSWEQTVVLSGGAPGNTCGAVPTIYYQYSMPLRLAGNHLTGGYGTMTLDATVGSSVTGTLTTMSNGDWSSWNYSTSVSWPVTSGVHP